jgi:hypothetical protein
MILSLVHIDIIEVSPCRHTWVDLLVAFGYSGWELSKSIIRNGNEGTQVCLAWFRTSGYQSRIETPLTFSDHGLSSVKFKVRKPCCCGECFWATAKRARLATDAEPEWVQRGERRRRVQRTTVGRPKSLWPIICRFPSQDWNLKQFILEFQIVSEVGSYVYKTTSSCHYFFSINSNINNLLNTNTSSTKQISESLIFFNKT